MNSFVKGLENETQMLVAVGSAIAAGCIPCLENIYKMAIEAGIAEKKLRAAALIGQFVKDQPAHHMKVAADKLLGTHLSSRGSGISCPAEKDTQASEEQQVANSGQQPCSCSM